jgi:hypothetical protein
MADSKLFHPFGVNVSIIARFVPPGKRVLLADFVSLSAFYGFPVEIFEELRYTMKYAEISYDEIRGPPVSTSFCAGQGNRPAGRRHGIRGLNSGVPLREYPAIASALTGSFD